MEISAFTLKIHHKLYIIKIGGACDWFDKHTYDLLTPMKICYLKIIVSAQASIHCYKNLIKTGVCDWFDICTCDLLTPTAMSHLTKKDLRLPKECFWRFQSFGMWLVLVGKKFPVYQRLHYLNNTGHISPSQNESHARQLES